MEGYFWWLNSWRSSRLSSASSSGWSFTFGTRISICGMCCGGVC